MFPHRFFSFGQFDPDHFVSRFHYDDDAKKMWGREYEPGWELKV